MSGKKLLILNGSPRKKGTSFSFALTIKKIAEEEGNIAEIVHIIEYLEEGKSMESLRGKLSESDILVLSSPLYVDSLPHPVIWFFEELHRGFKKELKGKSFFAVAQCAFPYPDLLDTLLGSCRCFSEAVGMKWAGGLRYGGGVMINGQLMENLGKKGEKITSAFRLALKAVYEGKEIAPEVQQIFSRDFPKVLARPIAMLLNHRIKSSAKKQGLSAEDIRRKAYLE
jgi:multimeric flavodoxin WrbA